MNKLLLALIFAAVVLIFAWILHRDLTEEEKGKYQHGKEVYDTGQRRGP